MNSTLLQNLQYEIEKYDIWLSEIKLLLKKNKLNGYIKNGIKDAKDIIEQRQAHYEKISRLRLKHRKLWSGIPGLTYESFYEFVAEPDMDEPTQEDYENWLNESEQEETFNDYEDFCFQQILSAIDLRHVVIDANYLLLHINSYFIQGKERMKEQLELYFSNTTLEERNSSILWMKKEKMKAIMTHNDMKKLVTMLEKLWTNKSDNSFKFEKENYIEALKLVKQWPSGSCISQQTIRIATLKSMVLALGRNAFS